MGSPVFEELHQYIVDQSWEAHFTETEQLELQQLCAQTTFDFEAQFAYWSRLLAHWDMRNLEPHRSVHSEILALLNIFFRALQTHYHLPREQLLPLRWKLAETQVDLQQKSLLFWRFEHDQAQERLKQIARENDRAQAEFYTLTELADFLAGHIDNKPQLIASATDALQGVMNAEKVCLYFDTEETPDSAFWKNCWALPPHQTRTFYSYAPDTDIMSIAPEAEVMLCQTLRIATREKILLTAFSSYAHMFNGFQTWFTLAGVHLASALKNAALNNQLNHMAIRDGLLNIYNRRYLEKRLDEAFRLSKRYERPLSLLMLDIDHFKRVNDTYGHLVGDEVLKAVAQTLLKRLRSTDILGRYGGEEFMIILQETHLAGAEEVASNLLQKIAGIPLDHHAEGLRITASIGISSYPAQAATAEGLVSTADQHLYLSKHRGRNCYTARPGTE